MAKSIVFFLLVLLNGAYDFVEADCTPSEKQEGLVAPIIPRDVVAFMEIASNTSKEIQVHQVYIDLDTSSAAIISRYSNHHEHYIYNFEDGLFIHITRNGDAYDLEARAYLDTCKISKLESENFGNVEQFFHYALANYFSYDRKLAYFSSHPWLGMAADLYTGCLNYKYNGQQRAFRIRYSFSAPNLKMPSGYYRVPVAVKADGTVSTGGKNHSESQHKTFYFFDHMKPKYHKYFQIPEGVYCKGYQKTKPFPGIEKTFVTNVEVLYNRGGYIFKAYENEQTVYHHKEFLSESLLMERLDFTPNGKNSLLGGKYDGKQVTVVHDLSSDSSFVMERLSGACDFYPYNVLKEGGVSHFRFTNNVIFNNRSDESYTYKGVEPCGDEACEVWLSDKTDHVKYFQKEISTWTDIRFLAGEWRDRYRKGSGKNWPLEVVTYLNSTIKGIRQVDTIRLRLYDYLMREPILEDFDVSSCRIDASRKYHYFELLVPKAVDTITQDHKIQIRSQVTEAFSRAADIPLPRIQDVFVYFNNKAGKAKVTFSVTSAYKTKTESISQPAIQLVMIVIRKSIDTDFVIELQTEKGLFELTSIKNSVKLLFPTKTSPKTYESMFLALQRSISLEAVESEPKDGAENSDAKKVKGKYGTGPLAAVVTVMMLLGIVLGSLATIFYFKKFYEYSGNHADDDAKSFAMEEIIPASLSGP